MIKNGDRVRVIKVDNTGKWEHLHGKIGKVFKIEGNYLTPYLIQFEGCNDVLWCVSVEKV